MSLKKIISAYLKLMLSALLLLGCAEEGNITPVDGYLTADIDNKSVEVSELVGMVKSERKGSGLGEVNVKAKVESVKGETIEFIIINYRKNKIYTLVEWKDKKIAETSGSLRYCVGGRFFSGSKVSKGLGSFPGLGKYTF